MFISFVMLFLWQATNNAKYETPFRQSADIVYNNSELKNNLEAVKDKAKQMAPVPFFILPLGYALGIKKQISLNNQSTSPIPNTLAGYNLNYQTKTIGITVTWRF